MARQRPEQRAALACDDGTPMSATERPSEGELAIPQGGARLSHYLFRYPAKFHAPVARALIERYTSTGETVLDPFVGSGTLLVEAAVAGRHGVGTDVDPLAVLIARVKVHRYALATLEESAARAIASAAPHERTAADYDRMMTKDLSEKAYEAEASEVDEWIPAIPNLRHWFRLYVIIDLARIREAIEAEDIPETHREFLRVTFAAIIRNASNADPVPVSGLEVTAHMRRRDEAGRLVNPFDLWRKSVRKALLGAGDFRAATTSPTSQKVFRADATNLRLPKAVCADAVVTSPPYHGAVDYYRRHQLEMFWLGLTESQADRLALLPRYIGRPKVANRDPMFVHDPPSTALVAEWHERLIKDDAARGQAFLHYMISMRRVFQSLARVLQPGSPAVFVVGDSGWRGDLIPTQSLFQELAGEDFGLKEVLHYPVKNRYMSYTRHNGADISREWVLALLRQ